jgi:phospholipid/cholesterol/gamma-HCH transport system permease protein
MSSSSHTRLLESRLGVGTQTLGRTFRLGARTTVLMVRDMVTMQFPWREAVIQGWFLITVTALPAILLAVPFGVIIAIQVGSLTSNLGASSMAGAVGGMGVMQQIAPLATGLLLGGAGASAVAADLGSRTIRDEIDAMRTMGIDPQRRLVAPRLAAMVLLAPLLAVLIIFMCVMSSFLVAIMSQGVASGSYWSSFGSFATLTDFIICVVKSMIFGFIVVIVAAQRGLEAKGGPRGVANAVNAAVVIAILLSMVANLFITQLLAMFVPPRFL